MHAEFMHIMYVHVVCMYKLYIYLRDHCQYVTRRGAPMCWSCAVYTVLGNWTPEGAAISSVVSVR